MSPMGCAACRAALRVEAEQVAALAAGAPEPHVTGDLCSRHLHRVLSEVPDSSRRTIAASRLEAVAAGLRRRRAMDCAVCSREEAAARQSASDSLCLRHLRRFAGRLTWEQLLGAATRLVLVAERGASHDLPEALWGSSDLVSAVDGDDACPVCAARTKARLRHFEWLEDAVHRFPAQAMGSAVALCATHGWRFATWSPASGDALLGDAAEAWARRLRWLIAGLDQRPADRLEARLAALPATLASLMDDAGRLPLAVIVRAGLAAVLRTPAAALGHLTSTAFRTEACPVCAAEEHASLQAAASVEIAVCVPDLRVVLRANPDHPRRDAVTRATADRLRREAVRIRDGAAVDRAGHLASAKADSQRTFGADA